MVDRVRSELKILREEVVACRLCPRLVSFREKVPAKAPYLKEKYWRHPVPGFGDPEAKLFILGLAPAAHGGNRTGRIFTGDASARFLMRMLYAEGLANQPTSESIDDGLELSGCYITASVKCVPPKDKPNRSEKKNCSQYFERELSILKNVKFILVLGKIAFDAYLGFLRRKGYSTKGIVFGHGLRYDWDGLPTLYASYHPSPRNVNTKKLSEAMFRGLLRKIMTLF